MKLITRIRRALGTDPTPTARVRATGPKRDYFVERQRSPTLLKKYQTIYDQGGLIAEAIDLYPLYMLGPSYRLEGDQQAAARVQQVFDAIGIEDLWWDQIVDAAVSGDGFVENIPGRGRLADTIVALQSIPPETMRVDADEYGTVLGYRQVMDDLDRGVPFEPRQITHFRLFRRTGRLYGISLVARALDEILRDTKTSEATAAAVERHGFPKYHIAVDETGEVGVSDTDMARVEKEFETIEKDNEFVTRGPVKVNHLDVGGVQNLQVYSDVSLQRVCSALGVPEELLGLRRGTTDATAVSRIEAFYKKINTLQTRLAATYTKNVVDRITGRPGAVWIQFNDVSPNDEYKTADMLNKVMTATPLDPFAVVSRRWAQERIGQDPAQWEKDEGDTGRPEGEEEP